MHGYFSKKRSGFNQNAVYSVHSVTNGEGTYELSPCAVRKCFRRERVRLFRSFTRVSISVGVEGVYRRNGMGGKGGEECARSVRFGLRLLIFGDSSIRSTQLT